MHVGLQLLKAHCKRRGDLRPNSVRSLSHLQCEMAKNCPEA